MARALISIDYTVDFVADEGKLTAGAPAQAISEAIAQVTEAAFDRGDYIFFAIDAHDENDAFHPESKLFPPHNIKGTSGRNLYGPLADFYDKHQAAFSRFLAFDTASPTPMFKTILSTFGTAITDE